MSEVILVADFIDLMQLRFDPIDMFFLIDNDVLQEFPRSIVAVLAAGSYPRVKHG